MGAKARHRTFAEAKLLNGIKVNFKDATDLSESSKRPSIKPPSLSLDPTKKLMQMPRRKKNSTEYTQQHSQQATDYHKLPQTYPSVGGFPSAPSSGARL